jgi:hypothetical protein
MSSNLIVYRGGRLLTREQLADIPTPPATSTWKPVPHADLVRALADQFALRGITITKEQLGVNSTGRMLFGTFDLALPGPEGDFMAAFGFRSSNDKSLAIRAVAGARVLVCENLALAGDEIVLRRKHTSGLRITDEAATAVQRFEGHYQHLVEQTKAMKARGITDDQAKQVLYDVFSRRILPLRLLPAAHKEWFDPRHEEFATRASLWRLHNALTEVAKEVAPGPRMASLTQIGRLFSHLLK